LSTSITSQPGQPVDQATLTDIPRLVTEFFAGKPDPAEPAQRVAFGTSGHRGSSLDLAFNEAHIVAIAQAICLYRAKAGISGPLFLGKDTHALSTPALVTALEVLAANDVQVMLDTLDRDTPTPAISYAILVHNRSKPAALADGIVLTPSHNPPRDGGFKYNPPHGGPAGSDVTDWIEQTANTLLEQNLQGVRRIPHARALAASTTHRHDYVSAYVADLANIIDMQAIAAAGINIGIDPLGGASVHYWPAIADYYKLNAAVTNTSIDPTFRFMTADWDGQTRMDCSSPYAMAKLIELRTRFDIAFANDPDADRHGIVCPSSGLMKPNHYLAAAIGYLFANRPNWPDGLAVGKTAVSSSLIDRVAAQLQCKLIEVPVGFKWFVDGLHNGTLGFGGEESAGASFLRTDGTVWTTDKDGLILCLLAAEMTARTGRDPGELYTTQTEKLGAPVYERIDAAATSAQKRRLKSLTAADIAATTLAGDPITAKLTHAPGNNAAIGGIKVITDHGWFAARPSGTEEVYKLYAESFRDAAHLEAIQVEAQQTIAELFESA